MLGVMTDPAPNRVFVGRAAKSRLLAEFTDPHATGATVLVGGCVAQGGGLPFTAALRALVRRTGQLLAALGAHWPRNLAEE